MTRLRLEVARSETGHRKYIYPISKKRTVENWQTAVPASLIVPSPLFIPQLAE